MGDDAVLDGSDSAYAEYKKDFNAKVFSGAYY